MWMAPVHRERTGVAVTSAELRAALADARSQGVPWRSQADVSGGRQKEPVE
jgi:hypothetical protein